MQKRDADIEGALQNLPFIFLERLLAEKMRAASVSNYESAAKALVVHIRKGKASEFTWEDGRKGKPKNLKIDISEEELAEIGTKTEVFMAEKFPEVLENTADACAARLLKSLKAKWPDQAGWQDATTAQFCMNLDRRWGRGLALLRMLLTIFREQGEENVKRLRRRKNVSSLQEVMYRLHARSSQVADEIITLLENGFADGAMARWRTLHELGVTALLMAEYGEDLAQRYIAHQFVESRKAMMDYETVMVPLGYKPISDLQKARLSKGFQASVLKYGTQFKTQYGWAAHHLNHRQPTFRDLERAANRAHARSHYQMAGYNVHASAKGLFFRLGSLNRDVVLAGRSNSGLTEPAQNTAYSLCLINSILREIKQFDLTEIVAMKAIVMIRDEISQAFWRAEKKLVRDDRAVRRSELARRTRSKRA